MLQVISFQTSITAKHTPLEFVLNTNEFELISPNKFFLLRQSRRQETKRKKENEKQIPISWRTINLFRYFTFTFLCTLLLVKHMAHWNQKETVIFDTAWLTITTTSTTVEIKTRNLTGRLLLTELFCDFERCYKKCLPNEYRIIILQFQQ